MDAGKRARPIDVESWGASLQGDVRAENQDSFLNWPDHMLWAVADGVGSSAYGGEASRAIANDLLREQSRATGVVAASTTVALLLHEGSAACVWAGDSRCYLLRDGVLYQCTRDHTLRQEKIDNGELSAPEATRMVRGNIITNAIGIHDQLRLDEVQFSLRPGDRLLLCSDGLFAVLAPETLSACLSKGTARLAVEGITEALKGLRQPDNITFVAVYLS